MTTPRVPFTWFAAMALLVALVVGGFASFYASSSPDGLDRVAADHSLAGTEKRHAAADSPLAGYGTEGVSDHRLSTAIAGISGTLIVLAVAGGTAAVVRRRPVGLMRRA